MKKNNKLGIIVVHYSNENDTQDLIRGLAKQNLTNFVIYIVVNNVNKPISSKYLIAHKLCKIIRPRVNLGWAGGADFGANVALSEGCNFLCFLTNDTIIKDPNFCNKLIKPLGGGICAATIPVVVYNDLNNLVWSSGGTLIMPFVYTYMNNNGIKINEAKFNKYPDFGGIGLTLNASTYLKCGGWDKEYFLYYEDVDISYKIRKIKPIYLVEKAIIKHKVSTPSKYTSDKLTSFSSYYYGRSSYIFVKKNTTGLIKLIAIFSLITLNTILFTLSMLKQKNIPALLSFYKGSLVGLSMFFR